MTIYTIGHSTRDLTEFIGILQAYRIDLLIDIRSVPKSRYTPQFNEENLASELPKSGIEYRHLASLGGLRSTNKNSANLGWRNASFRGYADYMGTPEFTKGIQTLIDLAGGRKPSCSDAVQGSKEERASRTGGTVSERQTPADTAMRRESPERQAQPGGRAASRRVAIMCAEAVPWRCHRSLVGDALLARGVEVIDIFDTNKSQPEKLTSFAKIDGQKITYPGEH